jgi:serine/threonine protein kinase
MNQSNSDVLPRVFGKYHLIERIATGGMAELFRAKLYGAGGFEKDLAIKKVLPHLVADTAFVQMFMDEAMITVTLNHGNIVSVMDFGEIDGEYYLVMEFVDGVDLQSLICRSNETSSPFPTSIACHIAHEICRGLDYAHRKVGADGKPLNIVHRDISPQNILISFEGEVKIADFGIARAASRISSTQAGVLKGKVAYMSPEQLLGQPVDNRSDIFAVANILYEMLTNHRPFEGVTPHETMALITRGVYTKPNKYNSKIPKKLSAVISKALEKNLKKRYRTAGEMAADIAALLHEDRLYLDASTVAAFISTRLPDSRPKTVQPTPIRTIRREAHALESTPISNVWKQPKDSTASGLPVAQNFPDLTSPGARTVSSMEAVSEPPSQQEGAPAAMQNNEAVSFDVLGLPKYLETIDSKRQTAPSMEAAVADSKPFDTQGPISFENELPLSESHLGPATTIMQSADDQPATGDGSRPHARETMLLPESHEPDRYEIPAQPSQMRAAAISDNRTIIGTGEDLEEAAIEHAAGLRKQKINKLLLGVVGAAVVGIVTVIVVLALPDKTNKTSSDVSDGPRATTLSDTPTETPNTGAVDREPPKGAGDSPTAAASDAKVVIDTEKQPVEMIKVADHRHDDTPKRVEDKPPHIVKPPITEKPLKPTVATTSPRIEPTPRPPAGKPGILRINAEPFAIVFVENKRIGPTPQMNIELPAGSHTIVLKNDALGITKRVGVRIEPGKVQTLFVDLTK